MSDVLECDPQVNTVIKKHSSVNNFLTSVPGVLYKRMLLEHWEQLLREKGGRRFLKSREKEKQERRKLKTNTQL